MESNHEEPLVAILIDDEEEIVIDLEEEVIEVHSSDITDAGPDNVTILDDHRAKTQFKKAPISRNKAIAIISAGLVIFAICFFALLESPLYRIDKVVPSTLNNVTLDANDKNLIDKYSKQLIDQPIYRLNTSSYAKKMKAIPSVKSIEIKKQWPSTVNVVITPRSAVGYIPTDKGFALVDDTGAIFSKESTQPVGLPSFEGMQEVTLTKKIPSMTFVNIVLNSPNEIKNQIRLVKFDKKTYQLELTDGIDVVLGDNTKLKEKLAITWSIILTKKRSELGYIDVSVPSLPVSGSPKLKVKV
ncbi:MAG: cell division protein FtsQ/DivIB [Acidimicrobiia bacterium]